ncbi:MAG TPA: hypothetical protein VGK99_08780 [Acidobacteriota bacterium]|jgi:hypothetical protein
MAAFHITQTNPKVMLAGGLTQLLTAGLDAGGGDIEVRFDSQPALVVGASSRVTLVRVPDVQGECAITISQGGKTSAPFPIYTGEILATELNPVSNPATDRHGNIFVAFSGSRGATVPFSVYRILAGSGQKEPFLADIVNATGIVVAPDDTIYISSRHTGTVYKSDLHKNVEKVAENLGIATGMALDPGGNLYVGDRSGLIHKIHPGGKDEVVCEIEPSVSAFHLALRKDGKLFVTGPTLATQDNIYEIGSDRQPKIFFHGFGRPQGIAFDGKRLLVTGSYQGRRGVFAVSDDKKVEQLVASPILVGLAIAPNGDLILADSISLYRVPAGKW